MQNMKPIALMLAFILFSSGLGYGSMMAYGQTNDQPCSVSHPCTEICGDHPCAPGETYTLSTNQTTTVTSNTNNTSANQTEASGMSTNVGVMDNVTVTKNPSNMTMVMSYSNATSSAGMTMTPTKDTTKDTTKTKPKAMKPKEQVASGKKPKDVTCESGFQLLISKFNPRPACVKSDVASMLVERGWGTMVQVTSKVKSK